MGELAGLFTPETVAIVGATDREGSIGRGVLENMQGFAGTVVPVNPNRERVLGEPCYPTVGDVPERVDLAVVIVPAPAVLDVLRDVGEAGVEYVVVISAGFGETGEEGAARQERLVALAEAYDLTLVGPNCLGLLSTKNGLNVTFAARSPEAGPVSFLSQSGAFVTTVLDWASARDLGFNDVVSLGNEAVLTETDFVVEWGDDPDTAVVLGYVEDIDDGRLFVDAAREVTAHTPVVLIKAGRTEAGARAAASHTGSLAGSDRAYDAAFDQAGVLRADTVDDLFDVGQALATQPLPDTDTVAVVTNAGGAGVMAADAISDSRLSLAAVEDDLRATLAERLPPQVSVGNPLDIVGDADVDRFRAALEPLLDDEHVGAVVVLSCPTTVFSFDDLARAIADLAADRSKPVAVCLMGGETADRAADRLEESGIPNYFDPARAVDSLAALADYRDVRAREYEAPTTFAVDRDAVAERVTEARAAGRTYLGPEALDLLDAYGIPTPAGRVAGDPEDAASVAADIDAPVVLKVVSPDVVHKSDVGGVEVGVAPADVADAYGAMVDRVRSHRPDARIEGLLVQEVVAPEDATETIVGASRDPQFGPLLMFGLGGVFVEVFEDATFRVAPVSEAEAEAMVAETDASTLLGGARGRDPADVAAVVETVQRVSQLVTDVPEIAELDINPLVASPEGVCAVDVRMLLDGDE